jgi:hypothetical protein
MKKKELIIEFNNQKALRHFAIWLCEIGEQDYWNSMQYREQEEDGNITVVQFHYHVEDKSKAADDPSRYGKFLEDNIIRTTCGRLDKK